jgi:hypothetical protein
MTDFTISPILCITRVFIRTTGSKFMGNTSITSSTLRGSSQIFLFQKHSTTQDVLLLFATFCRDVSVRLLANGLSSGNVFSRVKIRRACYLLDSARTIFPSFARFRLVGVELSSVAQIARLRSTGYTTDSTVICDWLAVTR